MPIQAAATRRATGLFSRFKSAQWQHRASVYRYALREAGKQFRVDAVPILRNLPVGVKSTDEYQNPSALGMSKQENFQTADMLFMELGTNLQAGDFVLITSGPDVVGTWYAVKGRPQEHGTYADIESVMVLSTTPPVGYINDDLPNATLAWVQSATAAGASPGADVVDAVAAFNAGLAAAGLLSKIVNLNFLAGGFSGAGISFIGSNPDLSEFDADDYDDELGLTGDGVGKHFLAGLPSLNAGGIGFYFTGSPSSNIAALYGGGIETGWPFVNPGLWHYARFDSTDARLYQNGVQAGKSTEAVVNGTAWLPLGVFATNYGPYVADFYAGSIGMYFIQQGMTIADAAAFNTLALALMSDLGRG